MNQFDDLESRLPYLRQRMLGAPIHHQIPLTPNDFPSLETEQEDKGYTPEEAGGNSRAGK